MLSRSRERPAGSANIESIPAPDIVTTRVAELEKQSVPLPLDNTRQTCSKSHPAQIHTAIGANRDILAENRQQRLGAALIGQPCDVGALL